MFRSIPVYQRVVDAVVAGLFLLFTLAALGMPVWIAGSTPSSYLPSILAMIVGVGVTVALAGALALRRRAPGLALAIAWGASIVQMIAGLPPLPANIATFGILYTAAAYGTQFVFWAGFGSAIVGAVTIAVYLVVPSMITTMGLSPSHDLTPEVFGGISIFAAAVFALVLSWTVGALVRTGVRARENREAQQRAEAQTAAEQERTRIARDMHDVVAHSLAVVIAQADGARYAADPASSNQALQQISSTARSALSDVRLLLTQLRHSQADGPQPTLADLEQLYAQVRGAGVDLRVDIDPAPPGEPPAAVQLAVYRILQEALTNALRHGGAPVEVALAWHADRVELTVTNPLVDSRRSAATSPSEAQHGANESRGHGLIGMRERAQLVGGTCGAGVAGDVFLVRATLPIGEAA